MAAVALAVAVDPGAGTSKSLYVKEVFKREFYISALRYQPLCM